MPIVRQQIPNLINGVSQQSPSLRLPTQAERQVNYYSTVVDGLKKRPPRKFIKKLLDSVADDAFFHTFERDKNERYRVLISGGDLRVFDLDTGDEREVNFPDGKDYLDTGGESDFSSFCTSTEADYTLLVNKGVVTAMSSDESPMRPPEALVYIKAGNYKQTYRIKINGTEVANYETDGDEADSIDTGQIAKALCTGQTVGSTDNTNKQLENDLPDDFSYQNLGHVIYIKNDVGDDFYIEVEDGASGSATNAIKKSITDFSKLPNEAPDGFEIQVAGQADNSLDNYYVRFKSNSGSTQNGVWKEVPAQGLKTTFDASTMPHALVSEADGTFTFKTIDYDERVSGDEDTEPLPSFVGSTLRGIFFFKNRMCFLSDQNVIMSRSGDFFNFWRTTARQLLDDDPIDVNSSGNTVANFNWGIPWMQRLVLMSNQTQFPLQGDQVLSPKTVSIDDATNFDNSEMVSPMTLGRYLYFLNDKGSWSSLLEYYLADSVSGTYDANKITNHVPRYVPGNVSLMTSSSSEDVMFFVSRDDLASIYVYKYYFSEKDRLQSSMSRWSIEQGAKVVDAKAIKSTLFLAVVYPDGSLCSEKIPLEPSDTDDGVNHLTLLDRRIDESQVSEITYDSATKKTSITLPYAADEVQCVTKEGMFLTVTMSTPSEILVDGNVTTTGFFIGIPYEARYRFSEFFLRKESQGGGQTVQIGGRLQLQTLSLLFSNTSSLTIEVTPKARKTYKYLLTGLRDGDSSSVSGKLVLSSGSFKVPLMTNSEGLTVDLVNDTPFPSSILSAKWTGRYIPRSAQ